MGDFSVMETTKFSPKLRLVYEQMYDEMLSAGLRADDDDKEKLNRELFQIINSDASEEIIRRGLMIKIGKQKADKNAQNEDTGETLAHIAVRRHMRLVFEYLIFDEIDRDITDNGGVSVNDLLRQHDYVDMKQFAQDFFMDVDAPSNQPGPSGVKRKIDNTFKYLDVKKKRPKLAADDYYAASGLKHTLHGVIYQLKLLMLFAYRGAINKYKFRLATEMDEAEKFDDLVFQYRRDSDGKKINRFLQAKHKQDETKTIGMEDLTTMDFKGEFSLPKYFTSFMKIRKNPYFEKDEFQDFIISTNIDFSNEVKTQLAVKDVTDPNDILYFGKDAKTYKLTVNPNQDLCLLLKQTSDAKTLARILLDHAKTEQPMTLKSAIFKKYHMVLAREVIDISNNKFKQDFLNGRGLSNEASVFREVLMEVFYDTDDQSKLQSLNIQQDFVTKLDAFKLKLSAGFGKSFELPKGKIEAESELIKLLTKSIEVAKISKSFTLKGSTDLNKLAGYVIIRDDKKLKFSKLFLNDSPQLPTNIAALRKKLKEALKNRKIPFDELDDYEITIKGYKTCEEGQQFANVDIKIPNDKITDQDIAEFFDNIVFAVNQPNERQLDLILKNEMGTNDKIRLVEADLVAQSFESELMKWFAEKHAEKGKEGTFFSSTETLQLIESIGRKLNNVMAVGLGMAYYDKLLASKIVFEPKQFKFEDFLREGKPKEQVYALKAGERLLASAFVLQTIEKLGNNMRDDVIFLREKTILRSRDFVISAFASRKSHNLMVLEAGTGSEYDENWICDQIITILSKNKRKKLLLIGEEGSTLIDKFKEVKKDAPIEDLTSLTYKELSPSSKEYILQKEVTFQGKTLKAKDIFLSDDISPSNLRRIIGKNELVIGTPIEKPEKFYLTQLLTRSVAIKKEVLQGEDILAISSENSAILTPEFEGAITYNEVDQDQITSKVIILDTNLADKEFEQLKQYNAYKTRNVHWLTYDSAEGVFHWKRSSLDPQSLSQYLVDGERAIFESFKSEEELLGLNTEDGTLVISGAQSTGKSAIVDYVASLIKEKAPSKWVLKINLPKMNMEVFYKEAEKRKSGRGFNPNDSSQVLDFLIKDLMHLSKIVEISPDDQELLRDMIQRGQVSMLFDGFADLGRSYRSIILDLFKGLKGLKPSHLIVTTTPDVRDELKDSLGVGYYNVEALNLERQVKFLAGYLQQKVGAIGPINYEVEATKLISAFTTKTNDLKLLKKPVVLEILSEVYKDNVKQLKETDVRKIDVSVNIYVLFEKFLLQQFELFYQQKYGKPTFEAHKQEQVEKEKNDMMEDYGYLALYKAAVRNNLEENLPYYVTDKVRGLLLNIKNDGSKLPQLVNENGDFLITAIEHFFISNFIQSRIKTQELKSDLQNYLLKTVLVDPSFQQTRVILDACFEANNIQTIKTLDDDFGDEMKIIWEDAKKDHIDTFAQQAAQEGHAHILKFITASLKDRRSHVLFSLYSEMTNSDGATSLHLAASSHSASALEEILGYTRIIDVKDARGRNPLHYAVSASNSDTVKTLLRRGANMNAPDANGLTPLRSAVVNGDRKLLKIFARAQTAQVKEDQTLIHEAVKRGYYKIVKYFIQENLQSVYAKDENNKTPIELAENHPRIKAFLQQNSETDVCFGSKLGAPIKCTISRKDLEELAIDKNAKVKDMVIDVYKLQRKLNTFTNDQRNEIFQTLSELAALRSWQEVLQGPDGREIFEKLERFKIYQRLIPDSEIENRIDESGYSTLHALAEFGQITEIPNGLLSLVNQKDNFGNTPIHYATERGNQNLVEQLVKNGANVQEQNINDDTPLHYAAKTNNRALFDYLLDNGAIKYAKNKNQEEPIHKAAKYATIEFFYSIIDQYNQADYDLIKKLVVESGDLSKVKYINSITKYRLEEGQYMEIAAGYHHLDIVEYFMGLPVKRTQEAIYAGAKSGQISILDKMVYLSAENIDWKTVLANGIKSGNPDMINLLSAEKAVAKLDDKYGPNRNMLYAALEAGQLKTAQWLVDTVQDIDLNHVDDFGENLAHAAAKSNNVDALKWVHIKGVDIHARNQQGKTALHLAMEAGNVEAAKWLVRQKLEFTFDNEGKSPFDYVKSTDGITTHWVKYMKGVGTVYDYSSSICGDTSAKHCLITKEDLESIAKEKFDNINEIVIDEDKLLAVLDKTTDLSKRMALMQAVEKFSNQEIQNEKLRHYFGLRNKFTHLERVEKIAHGLNYALVGKNVIGDIANGNWEGVAMNVGMLALDHGLAKLAGRVAKRGEALIESGRVFAGQGLKASARFLGRATGAFQVYSLVQDIQSFRAGNKDAVVNIAGDATILIADTTMLGLELAEAFGTISGVTSVLGPYAAVLDAAIMIGMDIYQAVRAVDRIEKDIPLSGWEEFSTGFRAFFHVDPSQYIKDLQEIEQANNKLTEQAIETIKNSTTITKSVFASTELIDGKLQYASENTFDFRHKWGGLKWSRVGPHDHPGTDNFCKPVGDFIDPGKDIYFCNNTIGVEVTDLNRPQTTLINLGDGHDRGDGFFDESNIFVVSNGEKSLTGGAKDDTFYIGKNFISGYIFGGFGTNTLDFSEYDATKMVYLNPSSQLITEHNVLNITLFQNIVGRKNGQDILDVDCGIQYLNTGGATYGDQPDIITIQDNSLICNHSLIIDVAPFTTIQNSVYGDVQYKLRKGDGVVNMIFDYKPVGEHVKNSRIFTDYKLTDIKSIEREVMNSTLSVSFTFSEEDKDLELNLRLENDNTMLALSDNTMFRFLGKQVFALQETNSTVKEIIDTLNPLAKKTNLLLMSKSIKDGATVTMNYEDAKSYRYYDEEKDNVKNLPSDPDTINHMFAGNGPNIYDINPSESLTLPLKPVFIYNNINKDKGNSLHLKQLIQALIRKYKWIPTYKCATSGQDLIITLEHNNEVIQEITLILGLLDEWYKTLEMIGKHAPLQIITDTNGCRLDPIPLVFDKTVNLIVIRNEDVEMNTIVQVDKQSTGLQFFRLNGDLIITNHFALHVDSKEQFSITLPQYYQTDAELKTITFQFKDVQFSIKDKTQDINNADSFMEKLSAYTNTFMNYNSSQQSPLGDFPPKPSPSPITTTINWFTGLSQYIPKAVSSFWSKSPARLTEQRQNSTKNLNPIYAYDYNQTLLLTDLLVRKYTKAKPYNATRDQVNYDDVQAAAITLVTQFEKLLEEMNGEMLEDFDPIKLQKQVMAELVNGDDKSLESSMLGSIKFAPSINEKDLLMIREKVQRAIRKVTIGSEAQSLPEGIEARNLVGSTNVQSNQPPELSFLQNHTAIY